MPSRYTWTLRPVDDGLAASLAVEAGVSLLVARVLLGRGIREPAAVRAFLSPGLETLDDPLQLPDMPAAVERITRAIARREPVLVFGDSDVDGVTSTAIVYEALARRGAKVFARVSNRLADGYGFPSSLIGGMRRAGIRLLILLDCGTNQPDEIAQLAACGIDTVVIDHHVLAPRAAKPVALVNPRRTGAEHVPCSAGLAFKLLQALCGGERDELEQALDLAALGTLADYASLQGDNRVFVAEGLPRILTTSRPGLRQLCESVGLTKATPDHVLRRLTPRLNAAGRLGEARLVSKLLIEPSATVSRHLADRLGAHHDTTKALHRRILMEAQELAGRLHFRDNYVMVVGRRGWHSGVMGPIAAQLADRFSRPAIAIAWDEHVGVGSGRSIAGFDLFDALSACGPMLMRYGGHPQACGLTIKLDAVETFRELINRHAHSRLVPSAARELLSVDAEMPLTELTSAVVEELDRCKPFGQGNPPPVVVVRGVTIGAGPSTGKWASDGRAQLKLRERTYDGPIDVRCDLAATPTLTDDGVVLSVRDWKETNE